MTNCIIYHVADMDGWTSAYLLSEYIKLTYGSEAILIPFNYDFDMSIVENKIAKADGNIYIADCCLPLPYMKKYADRIIWIDHHVSAITEIANAGNIHLKENYSAVNADIYNQKQIQVAACELVWSYCCRNNSGFSRLFNTENKCPLFVQLAGRYDVWDKHTVPGADAFNAYVRYMLHQSRNKGYPFMDSWFTALTNDEYVRTTVLNKGKELLIIQQNNWNIQSRKLTSLYWHGNYQIAIANVSSVNSNFFNNLMLNKNVIVGIIFAFHMETNAVQTSFYTLKQNNAEGITATDVMLSCVNALPQDKIKSFGGHKHACGMTFDDSVFPLFKQWVKNEIKK